MSLDNNGTATPELPTQGTFSNVSTNVSYQETATPSTLGSTSLHPVSQHGSEATTNITGKNSICVRSLRDAGDAWVKHLGCFQTAPLSTEEIIQVPSINDLSIMLRVP